MEKEIDVGDQESLDERPSFQVTDRRFWAQDEEAGEAADIPEKRYPSFVEELKVRTELAESKLKERLAHLEAENAAYRERLNRGMERRLERGKLELFQDFLEVVDNLERALQAVPDTLRLDEDNLYSNFKSLHQGVRLNLQLLLSKLKSQGVESIELLNQPFDPHEAEAVGIILVDDPQLDQRILKVLQPGYRYRGQLLRAARVQVGSYREAEAPEQTG